MAEATQPEVIQLIKVSALKKTNKNYDKNVAEWNFLNAMYDGIREVIRLGLVKQHERESTLSYRRRMAKLFGFGYTKSVVDIFHFYLFKKDSSKTLGSLNDNPLFKEFARDANLYGQDYDAVIMDIALYAIIQGQMGILIDKPSAQFNNMQEQIDARVYPYIAKYYPKAILDWSFSKDQFNRPYLSYLKLLEDDGRYTIWSPVDWQLWEIPKDKNGDEVGDDKEAVLINSGINPLGEIPFIWHYNLRSKTIGIGMSDVHEVSRIDLSIIRNMSQIEQIIDFAAFPMMRKPALHVKPTDSTVPQQQDDVGVEVILEFDPENPDSKPDWLEAKVKEPVEATADVISKKISEIYRASNIGGMTATEPSSVAQSGVAKKIDFQMLNSKLINKAKNLEATENLIIEFWLKWEGLWEEYKDIVRIEREKTYDIDTVAEDLENTLTSRTIVGSMKFNELLQKQTVRQMLPGANEKELFTIDSEIEEAVKKETSLYIDEKNLTEEDKELISQNNYTQDQSNEIQNQETNVTPTPGSQPQTEEQKQTEQFNNLAN